jgi:hypothetical protein
LRTFAAFWIDFILGDDWTVTATLLGTWGLHHLDVPA